MLLSFLAARTARDLTLRQIRAVLTLYRIVVMRFGVSPRYRYGDLFFMTEQLPNPASRVRLSDRRRDRWGYSIAEIDWQLTDAELQAFDEYAKVFFERGLRSPSQHFVARVDPPSTWRKTLTSAAHHLGTARMASDPSRGVVDGNLRVFGMENLFVCDGSTFPTVGSVNPGLTIAALGLRLGDFLRSSH